MNRDFKYWLLLIVVWPLIGYGLSQNIYVTLMFLLIPLGIVIAGGLILARLKHHGFYKEIEHDGVEAGLSVTAGAAAFVLVAVAILAVIPTGAGLRLFTLYCVTILPASIAFGIASYWTAKRFAKAPLNIGGAAAVISALLLVALLCGLVLEATVFSLDRNDIPLEDNFELPESSYPVLEELRNLHLQVMAWDHSTPEQHPFHEELARMMHHFVKANWIATLKEDYVLAQHTMLEGPKIDGAQLAQQSCFHEAFNGTPELREDNNFWLESGPYLSRRIAETSEILDGLEAIRDSANQHRDFEEKYEKTLYEGIITDENELSRQARYDLLYMKLPWECRNAIEGRVLI